MYGGLSDLAGYLGARDTCVSKNMNSFQWKTKTILPQQSDENNQFLLQIRLKINFVMPPNIQNKLKESKIMFTIFVASLFGFPHFETIMYKKGDC